MTSTETRPSPRPFLMTARGFALATVVVIVVLFGTAGAIVQAHELKDVHGGAAIALHVVTAGLAAALAGLAYSRSRGWWTAALATAMFVFTFIQASLGKGPTLGIHVPGSLLIVVTTIWLTAWLFSSAAAGSATRTP